MHRELAATLTSVEWMCLLAVPAPARPKRRRRGEMSKTSDLRITIDGSMGLVSNVSQHSGKRGTFVQFKDVITDVANRIVKRDGKGTTLGNVAGTEIQTIEEYVFTDRATGATYTYVLGAINAGSYIYASINSGASWGGQTLPITPTPGGRWFFRQVDNSVIAGNGRDRILIASQAYASITLTSAATTATATSSAPHPFSTGETVIIAGSTIAAYNGSYVITVTGATTFTYTFAGGASPATGNISATVQRLIWRLAGQAAPTAAPLYSLSTNDPPYNTGTVSMTQGSPGILGIGTTFTSAMAGKHISINGVDYTIKALADGGFTDTTHMTLTENFKEATAAYAYNIFRGVGDWLTGPRYCFSFYNPVTGHSSNVSPVQEVTEQNQFGRTITITITGSQENTDAYNNGYTQIQLFRPPANGYTLVAINEKLANNNTGAAITYVETAVKFANTYLTTDLAPFDSNDPPPAGISCLVFHQDRAWALTIDGRLRFSLAFFEQPFGVAVESWPSLPQFARVVHKPSGMLVVGGTSVSAVIVIQTAKADMSVDGFDPLTFRVFPLKSRKSGGFLYSAIDYEGDLIEFYRDKRLMTYPGRDDLGRPIQNKLKTIRKSLLSKVRLHWFSDEDRNFLLLSVPSTGSSTANDYTYVWDLDNGGLISEWNAGFSCFATVHDATTDELQLWAGDSTGAIYRLLGGSNQDAGANFVPVVKTSILRPLEEEAWTSVGYVELYVNDASGTWSGRIFIHEQASTGATDGTVTGFNFRVAPYKSQSAQGKKLVADWSHTVRTKSEALQLEVTFPTQNAALWIEKIVIGFKVGAERVS